MNQVIFGLLAETFIHPGSGQNEGAIDLPVAREAATDYPFVAGSSMKGALLDFARGKKTADIDRIFGQQNNAGELLVGDARILLLPIRSLSRAYRWVTCPHVLERIGRDCQRSGMSVNVPQIPIVSGKDYLGSDSAGHTLYLEERQLNCTGAVDPAWIDLLKSFVQSSDTANRLTNQLVIVPDDKFRWFASYGLAVQARNQLDSETKQSQNLWYEETLAPDTLMYCLIGQRSSTATAVADLTSLFDGHPYFQVGGNETVGQGWFSVKVISN